jgi:DNA-binding CsgD family transcriptional regulator
MKVDLTGYLTNLITHTNPEVIFISEPHKGAYIYCSDTEDLIGYSSETLLTNGIPFIFNLMHAEDVDRVKTSFFQMLELMKPHSSKDDIIPFSLFYRLKHKSGEWIWLENYYTPIAFDENGKVQYIFGLVFDKSYIQKGFHPIKPVKISADDMLNAIKIARIHKTNLFTPRENEIIRLSIAGNTNKEIGFKLDISEQTVKNYKYQLFKKAGVKNMVELAASANIQI